MNQGTEWGLLMKKKKSQKSRASVPLIHIVGIPLEITNSRQRNYQSRIDLAAIEAIAGMSLSAFNK
jgi:hypothetical protein